VSVQIFDLGNANLYMRAQRVALCISSFCNADMANDLPSDAEGVLISVYLSGDDCLFLVSGNVTTVLSGPSSPKCSSMIGARYPASSQTMMGFIIALSHLSDHSYWNDSIPFIQRIGDGGQANDRAFANVLRQTIQNREILKCILAGVGVLFDLNGIDGSVFDNH